MLVPGQAYDPSPGTPKVGQESLGTTGLTDHHGPEVPLRDDLLSRDAYVGVASLADESDVGREGVHIENEVMVERMVTDPSAPFLDPQVADVEAPAGIYEGHASKYTKSCRLIQGHPEPYP
jgi:hypothetical protein